MVVLYNFIALALLLGSFCAAVARNKKKTIIMYLVVFAVILIFISSCRYEYGNSDYRNYSVAFYRISERSFAEMLNYKEIGYQLLQKFLSLVFENAQIFFMVTSVVIIVAHFLFFYKYSNNAVLSVMLFYFLGIYFSSHNATRQYLAIGICLFAYHYAIQKKFWRFMLIVFIASTFHQSALIAVIIYPLCRVKVTPIILSIYLGLLPIVYFGYPIIVRFLQLFSYNYYTEDAYGMVASSRLHLIIPAVSLIIIIFLTVSKQKVYDSHKTTVCETPKEKHTNVQQRLYNVCLHMVLIDCVLSVIQVFHALNFGRISWYFGVGICIFYPMLIGSFVKSERKILTVVVVVAAFAYFFVFNYYGKLTPTPYDFFWNHL